MFDRIKREPVLLLTLAILILQGLADAGIIFEWTAPAVLVLGIITRFFTVPASEVY